MVFYPETNHIILFGGENRNTLLNDTWEFGQ
jgi:hypothetical protein